MKIADFGLSQKVYLQEYYRGDEQVLFLKICKGSFNKYVDTGQDEGGGGQKMSVFVQA